MPSNLPTDAVPAVLPPGVRVGHFGTYPSGTTELLTPVLVGVLKGAADRVAVLIGRNSAEFRGRLAAAHPELSGRVIATGELPADDTAARLAACDVLVQPYPDGVSGRRTSATSALALGVPLVTNLGALSEGEWATADNGVSLAHSPSPDAIRAAVETVLALSPADRAARADAGRRWYAERFALGRVIAVLRGEGGR